MSEKNKKNPNTLLEKLSPANNELLKNDIKTLQNSFVNHLEYTQAKDKYSATNRDFYKSLAYLVRDRLFERWIETQQNYYKVNAKRIYYISMEYLEDKIINTGFGLPRPFFQAADNNRLHYQQGHDRSDKKSQAYKIIYDLIAEINIL